MFARGFAVRCGKGVDIDKKAAIIRQIYIGDNSGIEEGSRIHGELYLGKSAMKGAERFVYTKNHEFSRLDVPMYEQGYQESSSSLLMTMFGLGEGG